MHEISVFFHNKKNLVTTIILAFLILSLPVGLMLVRQIQVFLPRAGGAPIEILDGPCVTTLNGVKVLICGDVPLKLLSSLGPPTATPSATPTPTPTPSATPTPTPTPTPTSTPTPTQCTTTALSKTPLVINNKTIKWTYTYPASTKIKRVVFPAVTGVSLAAGGQNNFIKESGYGQPLDVDLGEGSSIVTFQAIAQNACSAFTVPFRMYNNCGTEMPDLIGAGSASAYGSFCSSTLPPSTTTSTVTSGGDFRLTGTGQCQNGSPTIDLVWDRSDGGLYTIEKNPSPIPNQWPGQLSLRPILTTPYVSLNTAYSIYIQSTTGKKSDTISISSPTSCSTSSISSPKVLAYIKNLVSTLPMVLNNLNQKILGLASWIIPSTYAQTHLTATCRVIDDLRTAQIGQTVGYRVDAEGGVRPYTISWGGNDDVLHNIGDSNLDYASVVFSTAGTKQAVVRVRDHANGEVNLNCPEVTVVGSQTTSNGFSIFGKVCTSKDIARTYQNHGFCLPDDQPFTQRTVLLFDGSKVNIEPGSPLRDDQASYSYNTDQSGNYIFKDLPPGHYRVRTAVPQGYARLTDDSQPIDVTTAGVQWDFVMFPAFSIAGTVFIDYDGNGQVDADDERLPNETVTLELYDTNDESARHKISDATTDSQGNYRFSNLSPVLPQTPTQNTGGYRVTHIVPEGYTRTTDNSHYPLRQGADPAAEVTALFGFTPIGPQTSTTCYRIAESQAELGAAACIPYINHPTITDFKLKDSSPGEKQIWVRFEGFERGKAALRDEHITIKLVEKAPTVSGIDCTLDIAKENLKITIKGESLGSTAGKLTANKTNVDVLSWDSKTVTGLLKKPTVSFEDGQKFTIALTKSDGQVMPEQVCRVNRSLLSLGARLFCREPGKFDLADVKVTLVDETRAKVEETVTIDKDGSIGNLKTKLQAGKRYALSIKAPYSIRRNAVFTASEGTTVVNRDDGSPFILPVGDIAPVIKSDGKINSLDRAELSRQWRVLGSSNKVLTGDFNRDTKVNSIDWACMRYDFDASDDPIPNAVPSPTPTPSDSGGGGGDGSQASQSAEFKLQGPSSVQVNSTFTVKVNVRSDTDAANLFTAKLNFTKESLEVQSIDTQGSFINNFAEKFIDNKNSLVSIVGTVPSPGFKTTGSDQTMVSIVFKANAPSPLATIVFLNDSQILRNSDNQNILNNKSGLTLSIGAQ